MMLRSLGSEAALATLERPHRDPAVIRIFQRIIEYDWLKLVMLQHGITKWPLGLFELLLIHWLIVIFVLQRAT